MTQITEKSKEAFKAAAQKLNISPEIPDLKVFRPDLALYITAVYMLAVINEAKQNGKLNDITKHSVRKYEPIFEAEEGYTPGSSAGGFSFHDCACGLDCSTVGARLASQSWGECEELAKEHLDLWEIFILNVR